MSPVLYHLSYRGMTDVEWEKKIDNRAWRLYHASLRSAGHLLVGRSPPKADEGRSYRGGSSKLAHASLSNSLFPQQEKECQGTCENRNIPGGNVVPAGLCEHSCYVCARCERRDALDIP